MTAVAPLAAPARALRVVHYYPRALVGDGGPTLAVRGWLAGSAEAGADVAVACEAGDVRLAGGIGLEIVDHAGRRRTKRPTGSLAHAFAGADAVVLHSAWVGHNLRAAAAARDEGIAYVLTPHGGYHPAVVRRRRALKRAWWLAAERRLVRAALAVHVFFDEEREGLAALGHRGPVIVAPNPVLVPRERRWDGGSGGYVLWLGRYDVRGKGLDALLAAVAALPASERPQLRLHGPDHRGGRARTERLVARLGLADRVSVSGPVRGVEKWRLLERAAAFVYPSRFEAFGVAPAEAAAVGVPTLVTPFPLGRFLAARGAAIAVPHERLADGLREVGRAPTAPDAVRAAFAPARVAGSFLDGLRELL